MNAKYYFATLALVAGGVAIGSYIVPQHGELAMIYYRSGRLAEARRILENEMRGGDLSPSSVYYATQTYLRLGDIERAIELVELFVDANPRDLTARRILSKLYHEAGKTALYTLNLEAIERLAPSPAQRLELFQLYRLTDNGAAWAAMLERIVADNTASAEDILTLAKLHASRRERERALAALKLLLERHPKRQDTVADELRISLELDSARPDLAFAAAQEALRRQPHLAMAAAFADLFQQRGQPALALRIIEPFADRAADQPEFMRLLVSLEIGQGQAARALARLEGLERDGKLAGGDRNLLIEAALVLGRWDVAKAAFARVENVDLWQTSIEQMAREAIARNDQETVRTISGRLTEEFRAAFPVTAAEIALVLGETQSAQRWADEAYRRERLADNERIALAMVYVRLDNRERARSLLAALSAGDALPEHLALELAVLYVKLDLAADGFALFDRLARARPAPRLSAARTLLDARRRPDARDWDLAWAEAGPDTLPEAQTQLLTAAYFAAMDTQLYALAAQLARRLVDQAPTVEMRLRYARALALGGEAAAAIEIVRPLLKDSAEARAIYSVALLATVKAGTAQEGEVRDYVAQQLRDPALPQNEKNYLVYDLINLKAYRIVLPVLESLMREGRREFAELYIAALVAVRDKRQLRELLQAELPRADNEATLRALALVAFQQGEFDLARGAYLRILKQHPKDTEALKRLGQMAGWGGDSAAGRRYLEAFVAAGGDDYQADYYLGELIIQFPDWERATPHYQRALAKIAKLAKPTLEDQMLRAKLLYRLGRFDESVAAYEDLVRRFPRDRALRDEFYDVLNEMGRYDRARALRGGRAER
jgi:predicted Zn-dependent protease